MYYQNQPIQPLVQYDINPMDSLWVFLGGEKE